MSTIEDFENAPVGATATSPYGGTAFKTGRPAFEWIVFDSYWSHCDNRRSDEMTGYTLNPAHTPAPENSIDAFAYAWNLGHPVKEGQVVPKGTKWMKKLAGDVQEHTMKRDHTVTANDTYIIRTHEPLPEPEPDWLDAPAVIAVHETHYSAPSVWVPHLHQKGDWTNAITGKTFPWQELTDVTPLYPKETDK